MPIYWTKKGGISLRRTQQTKHNSTATSPSASSRPHFNLPPFLSSVQYERELLARSRDHSDLYPTREKVSLSLFSRGPGRIYIYCIRHSPGPAFTMLFNGKSKTFFFPPTSSSISKTSSFPYSILRHILLFLYFLFCFRNNVAGYGRPTDSFRN